VNYLCSLLRELLAGKWGGKLDSQLIVESVNLNEGHVVYSWGELMEITKGFNKYVASIQGDTIIFGGKAGPIIYVHNA
jgi:hypothetical protein